LYNVVVDTENTGKQLLQNGNLRRRVTIIPLNKIQSHPVPSRVQQAAVRLVGHWNFLLFKLLYVLNFSSVEAEEIFHFHLRWARGMLK